LWFYKMDGGVWPSPATAMHERRRALAKPMPACFATLLRPGTGALRQSGGISAAKIGLGWTTGANGV
jgi:hypothetical protein